MACCVTQHATTWAKVDPDLCRHIASSGLNGLITTMAISSERIPEGLIDNKPEQVD